MSSIEETGQGENASAGLCDGVVPTTAAFMVKPGIGVPPREIALTAGPGGWDAAEFMMPPAQPLPGEQMMAENTHMSKASGCSKCIPKNKSICSPLILAPSIIGPSSQLRYSAVQEDEDDLCTFVGGDHAARWRLYKHMSGCQTRQDFIGWLLDLAETFFIGRNFNIGANTILHSNSGAVTSQSSTLCNIGSGDVPMKMKEEPQMDSWNDSESRPMWRGHDGEFVFMEHNKDYDAGEKCDADDKKHRKASDNLFLPKHQSQVWRSAAKQGDADLVTCGPDCDYEDKDDTTGSSFPLPQTMEKQDSSCSSNLKKGNIFKSNLMSDKPTNIAANRKRSEYTEGTEDSDVDHIKKCHDKDDDDDGGAGDDKADAGPAFDPIKSSEDYTRRKKKGLPFSEEGRKIPKRGRKRSLVKKGGCFDNEGEVGKKGGMMARKQKEEEERVKRKRTKVNIEESDCNEEEEEQEETEHKKRKKRPNEKYKISSEMKKEMLKITPSVTFNYFQKSADRTYTCRVCGRFCMHNSVAKIHLIKTHLKEVKVPEESLLTWDDIEKHFELLDDEDGGVTYRCKVEVFGSPCNREFKTKYSLSIHYCSHFESAYYKCHECGKDFAAESDFQYHYESHERPYNCEYCEANFFTDVSLETHKKDMHLYGKNKCEICDKYFNNFKLKAHMVAIHGYAEKCETFICAECGRLFTSGLTFQSHQKTHRERPYACSHPGCMRRFYTQRQVAVHLEETHAAIKKYECDLGCGKRFRHQRGLKHHIDSFHKKLRDYLCTWEGCYKSFAKKCQLNVHMLLHTGEKPLQCQLCEYSCRQRNSMTWHMKKHAQEF